MEVKKIQISEGKTETLTLEDSLFSYEITLEKDASFIMYDIQIGSTDIEKNITINLEGENSNVKIYGLYILSGNTKNKSKISVNHMVGNSESTQIYRTILDDKSRADAEGKIYVAKNADGVIATMGSKNILLSDTATASAMPILEIYAEDVKCSHSATSGQLDPEALFYMRSRGIGEQKAKELLTYAFAKEIIDKIDSESFKEEIDKKIKRKLEKSCLHIYS
ncbi:MAG: SufD family Fe-S cluster assembly protein [Candidatus Peregrinibacteria bacterium]|nr:SufD family Fe-S cluster assembly protein [Candidatus Peregrinibacteria bacterium]MDZ4244968.1 SufD family Fe-S cluster assembly protein [Candidatus Gracilibacteria bacterium]